MKLFIPLLALSVVAAATILPTAGALQSVPAPGPQAGGIQGTSEYAGAGLYTWTVPLRVHSVLLELWGAGGGGSKAYSGSHAGDGGGAGGYVRTAIPVRPGATYTIVVGAGGPGATAIDPYGTPGGDGTATVFLDPSGTILMRAFGGFGGLSSPPGGGGSPDPAAMIGREGNPGLLGGSTGGPGGASVTGSLEPPYPLRGGSGGYHATNSSAGNGSDGYAILTW